MYFTSYNTYRQYYQKFKVQTEPSEPILFYDVEMQWGLQSSSNYLLPYENAFQLFKTPFVKWRNTSRV